MGRALELGWTRRGIVEVGADLGHSASRSHRRAGFHDMVAQAALGKIGLILALEVSRLSRANICSVIGTLIGDTEGCTIHGPTTIACFLGSRER